MHSPAMTVPANLAWKLLALKPSLFCTWRTLGGHMRMCRTVCRTLRSSWYKCWTEGNMALKRWIVYISTGTITESQWLLLTYHQPVMCFHIRGILCNLHAWETSLNPEEYGFTMESQCLVSNKCHRNLPDEESLKCNCVKCATHSCPCTERNVCCCTFCKCQANSRCKQCKNPNGIILTK